MNGIFNIFVKKRAGQEDDLMSGETETDALNRNRIRTASVLEAGYINNQVALKIGCLR